jgi:hypothetical protein
MRYVKPSVMVLAGITGTLLLYWFWRQYVSGLSLEPLEWVAVASVLVALLGNIASVINTIMNNRANIRTTEMDIRARREEQLYEERLKHINNVYSKLSKVLRLANGLELFMDNQLKEEFSKHHAQFGNAYDDFAETFEGSAIFLPPGIVSRIETIRGLAGWMRLVNILTHGRMHNNLPAMRDGEIEHYQEQVRIALEQAEAVRKELRRLLEG